LNDNDATPTINANNPTAVVEGTNIVFTLTLSAVSGLPVSVNYVTTAGSATNNVDYTYT
jgi:hypothetical protein